MRVQWHHCFWLYCAPPFRATALCAKTDLCRASKSAMGASNSDRTCKAEVDRMTQTVECSTSNSATRSTKPCSTDWGASKGAAGCIKYCNASVKQHNMRHQPLHRSASNGAGCIKKCFSLVTEVPPKCLPSIHKVGQWSATGLDLGAGCIKQCHIRHQSSIACIKQYKAKYQVQGGGGVSRQVKFAVVNFAVGNFVEPPGFCVVPPARVHNLYCWCARNSRSPEFCVGNFAVSLKREISHAKVECHEIPPPLK